MDIIKTSAVDFVKLATNHKHWLRSAFGDAFMKDIFRQHKEPICVTAQEAPLLSKFNCRMFTCNMFISLGILVALVSESYYCSWWGSQRWCQRQLTWGTAFCWCDTSTALTDWFWLTLLSSKSCMISNYPTFINTQSISSRPGLHNDVVAEPHISDKSRFGWCYSVCTSCTNISPCPCT